MTKIKLENGESSEAPDRLIITRDKKRQYHGHRDCSEATDALVCGHVEIGCYIPTAKLEASNAEIARLREVLKPFANTAEAFDNRNSDRPDNANFIRDLTIGHLRAARAALNGSKGV